MTRQRDSANAVISMEHVDLMMHAMLFPKDKAVNTALSYINSDFRISLFTISKQAGLH